MYCLELISKGFNYECKVFCNRKTIKVAMYCEPVNPDT